MNMIKPFIVLLMVTLLPACVTTPSVNDKKTTPSASETKNFFQAPIIANPAFAYPKHIALFLPMHGALASTGQAIYKGFLAADHASKQQNLAVIIDLYDTNGKNPENLYQEALSKNADFIVGPLSKAQVTSLAQTNTSIPILALNTLDNSSLGNNTQFFQFSLSKKDEIKQLADKAFQEGHRHAIFFTSKDAWGQSAQETLQKYWQSLGGKVVAELAFARNEKDFFSPIRELLVDKTLAAKQQALLQNKKQNRIPPARQDVDVIFLMTLPKQARQIYPAIHFFYAGNVPVYASSSIYNGAIDTLHNQDLNGIHFIDMPWILTPDNLPEPLPNTYHSIATEWPQSSGFQQKLYAFGIDAYHLTAYLSHPESFPSQGVQGATGILYLKNNHHIYRQLQWATIHQGSI